MKLFKVSLVPLMLVLVAGCGLFSNSPHPSDGALIKNFQANEADLNKLANMSNEDSKVVRIADDFTWLDTAVSWPRPESELGFSKERWDEYRRLFSKLNMESGLVRPLDAPGLILFLASSKGSVPGGGSSKGFAYSVKEPAPIVESLDNVSFKNSKKATDIVYKKLKGNWYLFYEISG